MKDTCKQAIFRKDKKKSQESCRSLERGDQDKRRTGVFQQTPSATSTTTTRSQSLAMSSPQAAPAPQEPEIPESIPSQQSPLSPEWIHSITNLMGHPLTSEIGKTSRNGSSPKLSLITLIL